jgi:hypothetical protein
MCCDGQHTAVRQKANIIAIMTLETTLEENLRLLGKCHLFSALDESTQRALTSHAYRRHLWSVINFFGMAHADFQLAW